MKTIRNLALLGAVILITASCSGILGNGGENIPRNLAGITVTTDGGSTLSLSPAFTPGTTSYSVTAGADVTTLYITAGAEDSRATVTIDGTSADGSVRQKEVSTPAAGSQMTVTITVEGSGDSKTYQLTISREAASAEARLSDLQVDTGDYGGLESTFDPDTTEYDLSVADSATSVSITPTLQDTLATVTIEGETAYNESLKVVTIPTNNTIEVVVTAADNATTKTYTLNVERPPEIWLSDLNFTPDNQLDPIFDGGSFGYTEYTLIVPDGTTDVTVEAVTDDADARLYMYEDGHPTYNFETGSVEKTFEGILWESMDSYPVVNIDLKKVTDSAFVYSKTEYAVTVRYPYSTDATLAGLESSPGFLEPSFAADTTTYDLNVDLSSDNGVSSVDLTPTTSDDRATVAINGASATSGSATSVTATNGGTIEIVVTAEDGTQETYTLYVNDIGPDTWSYQGTLGGTEVGFAQDFATDANSNVYLLDSTNDQVHVYNASQQLQTSWDITTSAPLTRIAVDRSNELVYVGLGDDATDATVRVYALDGTEQTGSTISGSTATFQRVKALAINPDNGNIYVADNSDISYYHTAGNHLGTFDNQGSGFSSNSYVDMDMMFNANGELMVSSQDDDKIYRFSADGSSVEEAFTADVLDGGFYVDEQEGLYITDKLFTSYTLTYHTVAGVEQWSLDLEVFSGSQSQPMAPIDFAPGGTVYIQAKDNSQSVLVYTR